MKKFFLFFLFFFGWKSWCFTQTKDDFVTEILQKIKFEQSTADTSFFPKGIFPVYRQYDANKKSVKADDNIFFNALICYTLKKLYPKFNFQQKELVDSIYNETLKAAHFYKNTKGRNTYNFWKTNPKRKVFPNSGWINWFDEVNALPDDMDDTAIMLLATSADSAAAANVHSLMQNFINGNFSWVKNTLEAYKNIPAYSTWFGQKMPIDFDACVMSNVLLMVQHNNLVWTKADSASLQYIVEVIKNNHHITKPQFIAPHYAKSSIFLYHISRLMSEKPIASLESLKPKLIDDALVLYNSKVGIQEKILLITALKRLGYKPIPTMVLGDNWEKELATSNEAFFIANMASMAKNPYKKIIGNLGIGKFYYYCTAYNFTLLLESLMID